MDALTPPEGGEMKKVIEGYVRMRTDFDKYLPPIIDRKEYVELRSPGLWDKVKITIEINEEATPKGER